MTRDATPAIEGHYSDDDRGVSVLSTPYNTVSFSRGLGDSGQKIDMVKSDCPACDHPTMLRHWSVNPTTRDTVAYYCNNPSCRHYHDNEFRYATKSPRASEPEVSRFEDD